jgi:hypothetical protein
LTKRLLLETTSDERKVLVQPLRQLDLLLTEQPKRQVHSLLIIHHDLQ